MAINKKRLFFELCETLTTLNNIENMSVLISYLTIEYILSENTISWPRVSTLKNRDT